MLVVIPSRLVNSSIYLADVSPIYHVVRFQYLHAHEMEVGGHHIVFLADPDNVGVREIRIQYGVDIGIITLVTPPES